MTRQSLARIAGIGLVTLLGSAPRASAQVSPSLGAADSYSVLAGSEVTNTGATTIRGNVGISPGIGAPPHFSGFGTVTFSGGGSVHDADGSAAAAQFDKGVAYLALDQPCTVTFAGAFKELAGVTLVPGVYCATQFRLSGGALTLNGAAGDTWIFKSASDLLITGGAAARVNSPSCNVWWRVVSSASFDSNSTAVGNILADTSITFAAGASLTGRALARTALVSLSSNSISACAISPPPTPTPTPTPTPAPCSDTAPDLFIAKSHTTPLVVGVNAAYSIGVFNYGKASSGAITVTDTLPTGLAFVSATGVSWTCAASGQIVTCITSGSVVAAGGYPNRIALTVTPLASAVPAVTNAATVTGGGDCDLSNNAAADISPVSGTIPVPTLSEWASIMLALMLIAAGIVSLRRRASS
jgi:uncharacterized repeat protein (TIGR01451 family)